MRSSLRLAAPMLVLALLALVPLPAVAAGPTFTVAVKSAFLRRQPSFSADPVYSIFAGQAYPLVGRTEDGAWLQISATGLDGPAWVFAGYGLVTGALDDVPITASAVATAQPAPPSVNATASAPSGVRFAVRVRSAFLRGAPSLSAARVLSIFDGEVYPVLARSADGQWLRLEVRPAQEAWALAGYGSVQGDVNQLPIGSSAPAPSTPAAPTAAPAFVVGDRARAIYQAGLALGNDPRAFSKVGDCMSTPPFFLAPFDKGEYRLGAAYAYLQETIANFAGSFGRESLSARDGLNVKSIFDAIWADPRQCQKGEGPLACEYRLHRPSLALISLGTNGSWQTRDEYESYLRQILDFSIQNGVLPILSTKADNLEGDDRFNQVMIKLAAEYELPLWDFAAAARGLPNSGLVDAYHLSWGQAYFDRPGPLRAGWQVRNLTALQAIDLVWRAVR